MADYLMFATERYALPILQPLAEALQAQGHGVHALLVDGAAGARLGGLGHSRQHTLEACLGVDQELARRDHLIARRYR